MYISHTLRSLFLDASENVRVAEQNELVVVDLNGGAAKRRNQNTVTRLYGWSDELALLIVSAGSRGNHICLVELLYVLLGDVETRCGLCLGLGALHKNSVQKRKNVFDVLDGSGHLRGRRSCFAILRLGAHICRSCLVISPRVGVAENALEGEGSLYQRNALPTLVL